MADTKVTINTDIGVLALTDVIPLPPKTTWELLTGRRHIANWWGDYVSIELHPGGAFEELWTAPDGRQTRAFGTVTQIAAPHLLELTWTEAAWGYVTNVHLGLRRMGDHTEITVIHKDWPAPPTEAVRDTLARHYHAWKSCLTRLKRYAATIGHPPAPVL
jgi:uncharacterized protein YndB with AHSA1/START domain